MMLRVLICLVVGGVLGCIGAFALVPWWEAQDVWRQSFGEWFMEQDMGEVAGFTALLWPHMPMWLLAAIGGLLAGAMMRGRAMLAALVLGLGLVAAPVALGLSDYQPRAEAEQQEAAEDEEYDNATAFAAVSQKNEVAPEVVLAWNLISLGLVFPFAMLGRTVAGGRPRVATEEPTTTEAA